MTTFRRGDAHTGHHGSVPVRRVSTPVRWAALLACAIAVLELLTGCESDSDSDDARQKLPGAAEPAQGDSASPSTPASPGWRHGIHQPKSHPARFLRGPGFIRRQRHPALCHQSTGRRERRGGPQCGPLHREALPDQRLKADVHPDRLPRGLLQGFKRHPSRQRRRAQLSQGCPRGRFRRLPQRQLCRGAEGAGLPEPPRRPPVSLRCLPVQAKRDRAAGGIRPRHNSRAETPASAKRRRRVRKLAAKHVSEETGIEVNFTVLPESEVRQEISQYRDGRVTRPHPFPW